MQYRRFGTPTLALSSLGFGAMRLPMAGTVIDEPRAACTLRHAIDNGINYGDTQKRGVR
jgi:hypothetical protein